jgi:cathepsin X
VDTTCTAANTCRTCDGSGTCREIDVFPNATIAEYGTYSYYTGGFGAVADKIKAEIYARGPGTYLLLKQTCSDGGKGVKL